MIQVPIAYNRLPQDQACQTSQLVTGSAVNSFGSALIQLSRIKFQGHAHFRVARYTFSAALSKPTWADFQEFARGEANKAIPIKNFYYQTMPTTDRIAFLCRVVTIGRISSSAITGSINPQITVYMNTTAGATLDAGLTYERNTILMEGTDNENSRRGWIYSGADRTSTSSTFARPLILPSANAGDVVSIKIAAQDCKVVSLDLFDLHPEGFTP